MQLDLDRIARVRFLRWSNGAGRIELRLTTGQLVWLPGQITEKSTTASQAIVDCLASACPKTTVEIA
jgi:hypothetical protein